MNARRSHRVPIVAHLVHTWLPASETFIHGQVAGLRRYQPLVLSRYSANLAQFPCGDLLARDRLRGLARWRERVAGRLRRYPDCFLRRVRRDNVVLLHAHFGHYAWEHLPLVRASGLPLVSSFYSFDSSAKPRQPGWPERFRELFAAGTVFLAISEDMKRDLIDLGCPADKIRVNRLGIDLQRFAWRRPPPRREGEPFRILSVARFVEKKGLVDLVEALALVRQVHPEAVLDLIGDGPEHERIEAAIARCGLGAAVRLRGYLPYGELALHYAAAHLFALPSRLASNGDKDDLSMVTLEALATGLPVLTTRHAGIAERLQDGVHALLAPESAPVELARRIVQMVRGGAALSARLSRAGRQRVEEDFDVRVQVRRIEAIYEGALAGGRSRSRSRQRTQAPGSVRTGGGTPAG